MEYITSGILVFFVALQNSEFVRSQEFCNNLLYNRYCDDGYECCENGSKCCLTRLPMGAIIGIGIGCMFFIALCFACICGCYKKKYHQHNMVGTSVFSNNPHSTVTVIGNGNGRRGYGGHPQVHQVNAFYGYGVAQPGPVPGMVQVAPPAYSQYNQYGTAPHEQSMFSSSYSSSPIPPVGSSDRAMCGPLAPAYSNPANTMFKGNYGNINTSHS